MPSPVYLDNHLLVIDKPAGMLSQADRTGDEDVLSFWKTYLKTRFEKPGNVYLGLVHRLDRPASGLMILARTSKAARRLSEAFRERRIVKEYYAVVEGSGPGVGRYRDHLIREDERVRIADPAEPGAQHAEMEVISALRVADLTLVRIRLSTGRRHQIRIQLASRGMPILGDFRYGARRELDGRNLALHAFHLAFEHPVGGAALDFIRALPPVWPETVRALTTD